MINFLLIVLLGSVLINILLFAFRLEDERYERDRAHRRRWWDY